MSLVDTERAFARVCFAKEVAEADLAALSPERERWLLYRRMVRSRLREIVDVALPRTRDLVGKPAFEALITRSFDQAPPRTRFIREMPMSFTAFALDIWAKEGAPSPAAIDLLRLESTVWHLGWMAAEESPTVVDLDFDRVPVLNRALRLVDVEHAVHKVGDEGTFTKEPYTLAVSRHPETFRVETYALNPLAGALVHAWAREDATLAESVRRVTMERGVRMSEHFLGSMSAVLADLVDRRVLLGSR